MSNVIQVRLKKRTMFCAHPEVSRENLLASMTLAPELVIKLAIIVIKKLLGSSSFCCITKLASV